MRGTTSEKVLVTVNGHKHNLARLLAEVGEQLRRMQELDVHAYALQVDAAKGLRVTLTVNWERTEGEVWCSKAKP